MSQSKKVLVYSHVPLWSVHHAETIEIVNSLVHSGHEVFLLSCLGDLASCPANPTKDKFVCNLCSQQTTYSKSNLLPLNVNHLILNLSEECDIQEMPTNFEGFRDFEYEGVPIGKMVLSQLVDELQDIYVEESILQKRGKREILSAVQLYKKTLSIIRESDIDEVYVWNGRRGCDGPVLYAGISEGKRVFSHISGSTPEKYAIFPEGGIHSTRIRMQLIEDYYEKNTVGELKNKYFKDGSDFFYRQRYTGQTDLAAQWFGGNFETTNVDYFHTDRKKLVIFTSSYWEWIAASGVEVPNDFRDPYNLLNTLIHDSNILEDYEIIIRWHPNLVNAGKHERRRMKEILSSDHDVLQFEPESNVDSYQLLLQADLVLTFGSTLGIEATYYGKTSVVAGPCGYMGLNSVYEPKDFRELKNLLRQNLTPKPILNAIKYGSWNVNYGQIYEYVKYDDQSRDYELFGKRIKSKPKKNLRLQIQRMNFHFHRKLPRLMNRR